MKSFNLYLVLICLISFNSWSQSWKISWENQMGTNRMDFFADVIEEVGASLLERQEPAEPSKSLLERRTQ